MVSVRRLSVVVWLLLVCMAGAGRCQIGGAGDPGRGGGDGGPTFQCPDIGTMLLGSFVADVGSQDCPALRIGPGIPFVGQIEIFSIGTVDCPVFQELVPAHHAPMMKKGFRIEPGAVMPIRIREVTCSSASNLLVIGTSACDYGHEWKDTPATVVDWKESPCP